MAESDRKGKNRTSNEDIETIFNQLSDLALNSDPLEEKFFLEMEMVEHLAGMINELPAEERREWIHHILGSLVGAIEGGKVPPRMVLSRN